MKKQKAFRTRVRTVILAGAAMSMATSAVAAAYIKIPPIDGESQSSSSSDSGEPHLDYLVITLERARVTGSDEAAGDEHEIEYDIAAGAFVPKPTSAADQKHESWIPVEGISYSTASATSTADTAHGSRLTGIRAHKPVRAAARPARAQSQAQMSTPTNSPRDAATGLPTGKRQHRAMSAVKPVDKASPLLMRAAASWAGCEVGARYPHIVVGNGEGGEYKLHNVEVAKCAREHVSFTYQKIGS